MRKIMFEALSMILLACASASASFPQYPGRDNEMYRYFARALRYPVQAAEKGILGKVHVTFVVEPDGKISDARVVRKVNPLLDSEALKAVQGLKPFEAPSGNTEEASAKCYVLPVNFTLGDITEIDTTEVRLDENFEGEYLDEVVVMSAKN
ncbi:MAG: energy transducer TonB [Bacteroides sp.]|nr:energy transducer TonB [Bacteroides sp.]MCM1378860.1 energy transducer TonB [Bacteroides sp.]MCM1445477.1 energy transducer TonB [Prevotella sp.]